MESELHVLRASHCNGRTDLWIRETDRRWWKRHETVFHESRQAISDQSNWNWQVGCKWEDVVCLMGHQWGLNWQHSSFCSGWVITWMKSTWRFETWNGSKRPCWFKFDCTYSQSFIVQPKALFRLHYSRFLSSSLFCFLHWSLPSVLFSVLEFDSIPSTINSFLFGPSIGALWLHSLSLGFSSILPRASLCSVLFETLVQFVLLLTFIYCILTTLNIFEAVCCTFLDILYSRARSI